MATVDEILAAMPNVDARDTINEVLVIDPNTRQINIPGSELIFGVVSDENAERKYFLCPRYVGNDLDLTTCFLRVNYRNANGEIDAHLISDVALTEDGENITFSWELARKVTQYKGQIAFVICATRPGDNGKLLNEWHTTQTNGIVLDGVEPTNVDVTGATTDVITQLITMVEAQTAKVATEGTNQVTVVKTVAKTAQDDAVAQVEAKGASTLATIPGDYTAAVSAVQSAANAIRKKVSGAVIRVDDVSPMEHYPEIWVHGKNILPYPYKQNSATAYGGTFTVQSDGGVLCSGIPTDYVSLNLNADAPVVKSGNIVFSASGDYENVNISMVIYDKDDNVLFTKETWKGASPISVNMDNYPTATRWLVFLKRGTPNQEMRGTLYPQIEVGTTATAYTPYIDPTTVKVRRCGRNIIPPEYSEGNLTRSGITWETLSDGRVRATGTTDSTGTYLSVVTLVSEKLHLMSGVTYHFSCIPTKDGTCYAYVKDANSVNFFDRGNGATFTPTVSGPAAVTIVVSSNATVSGVVFSPMLEVTSKASAFEQSESETQIPASDGTVSGLTAVSPTMTLLTDTAGVTIDCEYSRDTNAVIAEILEKITALGG